MKIARTLVLAAALLAAGLAGCRPGTGADGFVSESPEGLVTISIGAIADLAEPVSALQLDEAFEYLGQILDSEDPRTFLKRSSFAYIDERSVLAYSSERVIRLSLEDGSFQGEYGRLGRGPGEYVQTLSCYVQDGVVYVNDQMSTCHVYDLETGEHLRDIPMFGQKTSQFSTYVPMDGERALFCYSTLAGKKRLFDLVDYSGQLLREGTVIEDGDLQRRGGIRIGYARRIGDYLCVPDEEAPPTFYQVHPDKDVPWLTFDLGNYKASGNQALILQSYYSVGPYFGMRIDSAGKGGLVFCDIRSHRLVHFSSRRNAKPFLHEGFPFQCDGQTLWLCPEFAERNLLICREEDGGDVFYCFRLKK